MSDITNKLLTIIHDTIDNIKNIDIYGNMFMSQPQSPYIKVVDNNLFSGSRRIYNPNLVRYISYWDGDEELSKVEYNRFLKLPDHIKEKAERKTEPLTITLELGSKPPIEIKREYVDLHVAEEKIYNLPYWFWTKPTWIKIKYIESLPIYSIISGSVKVNIDESTFNDIYDKILDKKDILDKLELTKQQDKDLQILEERYNIIKQLKKD